MQKYTTFANKRIMQLYKIETGNFMADGGALFGVVPKVIWEKRYPCNDQNYCNLSMRCLLIKTEGRVILIDTGVGNKQSEQFFSYQHLNGDDSLHQSFANVEVGLHEVTDVVLTHLHFDHCGGAVEKDEKGVLKATFPNAKYWAAQSQWDNYLSSNVREGSVYFKENMMPIFESGNLELIDENTELCSGIELRIFNGHTKGQVIPFIKYKNTTIVYTGDLIPVMASLPTAWVSAYDTDPITSMEEKTAFLSEAADNNYTLFFEHDLYNECCTLLKTERGIKSKESFKLEEIDNYL